MAINKKELIMIQWTNKPFKELSPFELYAILQLRNEVFVVEQNCVFQDADDKDQLAIHLMGWKENKLVAYTRLFDKGLTYDKASIGRVVSSSTVRGSGIGKELMSESIQLLYSILGKQPIKIGAQFYLKKFYESFGFQQTSDIYLEDGIEHIEMVLK